MGSNFKNSIKRKTHKERSQPAARRKFGLLEKKKDYLLRAKDFHKKENTLKALRRKAEERNPDEFYFAMEKARTRDGVHVAPAAEANKYSQGELRLMKTQDVKYLGLKAQAEAKKAERMRASLQLLGAPAPVGARHTVFVEDEAEAKAFDPEAHFDTPGELLGRTFNRPRRAQLADPAAVSAGPAAATLVKRLEKRRLASYRELAQREERGAKLAGMAQKMAYEKEVMGKGRKRKLSAEEAGGQRDVFKWKAERKR